jgi:hypothetical protein
MKCVISWCAEDRVRDALFCRANGHLYDWYAGRIRRLSDGSYIGVIGPVARTPAWRRWTLEHHNAKDLSGGRLA